MNNPTNTNATMVTREPWNKGKLIGQKPPLRPKHVWSIRTKLQIDQRMRDLAMLNLAIDSKLRGCDVVALKVEDVAPGGNALDRATVRQKKTGQPVRFELTELTRQAIDDYVRAAGRMPGEVLFPGRRGPNRSLSTRQYARLVSAWIAGIGLDPHLFGTHSLRRTKASLIYRRTGNLRAVHLLLGHTKIGSPVRYSASRSMMPLPSPSKSTSELPGQSRNALPAPSPHTRPRAVNGVLLDWDCYQEIN